jgi:hypothetical protein
MASLMRYGRQAPILLVVGAALAGVVVGVAHVSGAKTVASGGVAAMTAVSSPGSGRTPVSATVQMTSAPGMPGYPTSPGMSTPPPEGSTTETTYVTANLKGMNEIPNPNREATGDRNGWGVAALRITGSGVAFAIRWKNIGAPTEGHIHVGARGMDGDVKIELFNSPLPDSARAVTGSVIVTDSHILSQIRMNPAGFYVNLHTKKFPGGAIRGQLGALGHAADLDMVLRGGPLSSLDSGDQEITNPNGEATRDLDGRATSYVSACGSLVRYALSWSAIGRPTEAHIHQGSAGIDGPVAVMFFGVQDGLPSTVDGVAGEVAGVDPRITRAITESPSSFYTNVHTVEFPGGAVRGQLFRTGFAMNMMLSQ